jgi:hypothetical protein
LDVSGRANAGPGKNNAARRCLTGREMGKSCENENFYERGNYEKNVLECH